MRDDCCPGCGTCGPCQCEADLADNNDCFDEWISPEEAVMMEEMYDQHLREDRMSARVTRSYNRNRRRHEPSIEQLMLCQCGQYCLEVRSTPTRNYGGGWDTFYKCHFCGYVNICV